MIRAAFAPEDNEQRRLGCAARLTDEPSGEIGQHFFLSVRNRDAFIYIVLRSFLHNPVRQSTGDVAEGDLRRPAKPELQIVEVRRHGIFFCWFEYNWRSGIHLICPVANAHRTDEEKLSDVLWKLL